MRNRKQVLTAIVVAGLFGLAASPPAMAEESAARAGAGIDLLAELKQRPSFFESLAAQYRSVTAGGEALVLPAGLDKPADMTLHEAVVVAVKHNPGLIGQSLAPLSSKQGIRSAYAQFEPIFSAEASFGRTRMPTASALQGADAAFVQVPSNWNFSLAKGLRSGGQLELEWSNNRLNSNNPFQQLAPQYTSGLQATLNQPLLRGFGLHFTSLRIRVAEGATEQAVQTYRANVANFVSQVVSNYWAVVGLRERVEVLKGSLDLAQQTVRDNRTRVDVGVLAPVAVLESEAEVARRQEDLIVADNDLQQSLRRLTQTVHMPTGDPFFPRPVNPIDEPGVERVDVDQKTALTLALERRGEVRASRSGIQVARLNEKLQQNATLPKLDVFGSGGLNSLAGSVNPNPAPFGGGGAPGFVGDYGDAVNRVVDGRFYSYTAGVRIEVPLINSKADADYTRARVEHQQAYSQYRQAISDITLEVGQASGDVLSGMQRIEAAKKGRELAEENLRNQTKRYDVGMTTTTDLLKFQNDVAAAKLAEIQARIEYNISLASFARAQGTLLEQFNVVVEGPEATDRPWWAQF